MGRIRLKGDILKKAHELEDSMLALRKMGRNPITMDEYRLKIEALRWVLGDRDSL